MLQDAPRSLEEIARALNVSKGAVSTDARALQARGLLERAPAPTSDRRDYYVVAHDLPVAILEDGAANSSAWLLLLKLPLPCPTRPVPSPRGSGASAVSTAPSRSDSNSSVLRRPTPAARAALLLASHDSCARDLPPLHLENCASRIVHSCRVSAAGPGAGGADPDDTILISLNDAVRTVLRRGQGPARAQRDGDRRSAGSRGPLRCTPDAERSHKLHPHLRDAVSRVADSRSPTPCASSPTRTPRWPTA